MIPTRNPDLADVVYRVTVEGKINRRKWSSLTGDYELTGEVLPYETTYGPYADAEAALAQGVSASRGVDKAAIVVERGDISWRIEKVTAP